MNTSWANRLLHEGARLATGCSSKTLRTKRRLIAVLLGHAGPWWILRLMAEPLWLVLDADDTPWEKDIFFEESITEFTASVDHSELTPADGRAELDKIETLI